MSEKLGKPQDFCDWLRGLGWLLKLHSGMKQRCCRAFERVFCVVERASREEKFNVCLCLALQV